VLYSPSRWFRTWRTWSGWSKSRHNAIPRQPSKMSP
jgi:hypothetical protein